MSYPLPTQPDFKPASLDAYLSEYMDLTHLLEREAESGLLAAMFLAHGSALTRGWHHDPDNGMPLTPDFPKYVALMHSELSEALEGDRKNLRDDKLPEFKAIEVELADLLIRLLDTAAVMKADIISAFIVKRRLNMVRKDHDPEARAGENGKRY